MNSQIGGPVGMWGQPNYPQATPPQFGYQPVVPIYQQIVTPPAQVIIQRERRSHLEGLALAGFLFMISRSLRERSSKSASRSDAAQGPVAPIATRHYSQSSEPPSAWLGDSGSSRNHAVFGDGMVHVGVDVAPGTYRCEGIPGEKLFWARLEDASGEAQAVKASFFGSTPNYVTLREGEFFRSERSGGWRLVFLGN